MRLKLPKISGKVMDDTQRVVLSGLGGALMAGGVAWASAVSVVASYSWPVRFLPAGALFGVGALLFVWVFLSGPDSKRELLDRAIEDGQAIQRLHPNALPFEWDKWEKIMVERLQRDFGLQAAYDFSGAGHSNDAECNLRAQIAFLEGLRKRQ